MTLLLALGACQPAPPAAVDHAPSGGAKVVAPKPLPPLQLKWSFKASADACHAAAIGAAVRLDIAVVGHDPIELKLSGLPRSFAPAGRRIPWQFRGSAGNWRLLSAARASHDLVAYIAPGEVSSSKVLALLSGGVLAVGSTEPTLHRLRLPAADTAGQGWFDCVRRQR